MQQNISPLTFSPDDTPASAEQFDEYRMRTGDVLELVYQIRPVKTDNYYLNIEDVVEIRFPSMPENDTQQIVRSDGKITLPYIGDVTVVGLTPGEATQSLRSAYQNVLRFPDIYLVLKESGGLLRELKKLQGQTKLLTVRPDGVITFPLLGDMPVVGKTVPEVSASLNDLYSQHYPEVQADIILSKTAGMFVYVLGEVNRPGAYEMKRPMTLTEVLSTAGGITESAKLSHVALSHRKGTVMTCRIIDFEARLNGEKERKADMLNPDDVVYIPKRPLATAAQAAKEISELLFFRGFSVGTSWKLDE
jgi:polysaccharide export outer membrane protein